jgi:hypothetical protein
MRPRARHPLLVIDQMRNLPPWRLLPARYRRLDAWRLQPQRGPGRQWQAAMQIARWPCPATACHVSPPCSLQRPLPLICSGMFTRGGCASRTLTSPRCWRKLVFCLIIFRLAACGVPFPTPTRRRRGCLWGSRLLGSPGSRLFSNVLDCRTASPARHPRLCWQPRNRPGLHGLFHRFLPVAPGRSGLGIVENDRSAANAVITARLEIEQQHRRRL